MDSKDMKYLIIAILANLALQIGAMVFIVQLLVLFHDSAREVTSIIGLLSVIIGFALANYFASLICTYINADMNKKPLGLKGNNIATVFLVTLIPLLLYSNLDYLEENMSFLLFNSIGVFFLLIGILINFALNFIEIKSQT